MVTADLGSGLAINVTESMLSDGINAFNNRFDNAKSGIQASTWAGTSFPRLVQLLNDNETGSFDSSALYQSMSDHSVDQGPLEFPIMAWPKYIINTKNTSLRYNEGFYSGSDMDLVQSTKMSFVNWQNPTIGQLMRRKLQSNADRF